MAAAPSPRTIRVALLLGAAVLLAGLAIGLVRAAVKRAEQRGLEVAGAVVTDEEPKGTPPEGMVDGVVARRDLYIGMPLTEADVGVRRIAAVFAPPGSTFGERASVLGRTPRERVLAGEPLRAERLADAAAGVGLNAVLTPGYRGMTLATDTESGMAGLLRPGNHVDVIVTLAPDDPTTYGARWVTETLLQDVKVLAVGTDLDRRTEASLAEESASGATSRADTRRQDASPRQKPSITLEVDPVGAEKLALALERGEVRVVLRSDIDTTLLDQESLVTAARLIGYVPDSVQNVQEAPPKRVARKRGRARSRLRGGQPSVGVPPGSGRPFRRAEVIQGAVRSNVTFPDEGPAVESVERKERKP
jgi:pilus assembly protein CpaB